MLFQITLTAFIPNDCVSQSRGVERYFATQTMSKTHSAEHPCITSSQFSFSFKAKIKSDYWAKFQPIWRKSHRERPKNDFSSFSRKWAFSVILFLRSQQQYRQTG
jgi:hypothetical protein